MVALVCSGGWGWVRVAVYEPSDEPLRKGETQRTKPSVLNFYPSADPHIVVKSGYRHLWNLVKYTRSICSPSDLGTSDYNCFTHTQPPSRATQWSRESVALQLFSFLVTPDI